MKFRRRLKHTVQVVEPIKSERLLADPSPLLADCGDLDRVRFTYNLDFDVWTLRNDPHTIAQTVTRMTMDRLRQMRGDL